MAALNLQPITPFIKGSNPAESWKQWKANFTNYKLALKYHKEEEAVQIALFLQVCGEDLKRKFETFTFPPLGENEELKLSQVIAMFDRHFEPYKNLELASFVFWNLKQEEDQTFDDFLTTIILQAHQCQFGAAEERNIKDKIFHGIRDSALRERLLLKPAWSLDKLIDYCKTAEISHIHATDMAKQSVTSETLGSSTVIEVVRTQNKNYRGKPDMQRSKRSETHSRPTHNTEKKTCFRCGLTHPDSKCPALGSNCYFCGRRGHWEQVCRQKTHSRNNKVNDVECDNESDIEEVVYLGEMHIDLIAGSRESEETEWFEDVNVEGHTVQFKLDTGAQVNILPKIILDKWKLKPPIIPTKLLVSTYTEERIPVLGKCRLQCRVKGIETELLFVIVDGSRKSLLGLVGCTKLKLIKRSEPKDSESVDVSRTKGLHTVSTKTSIKANSIRRTDNETPQSIVEEFQDVFEGMGCLPGKYHIVLKPDATPHIASPRIIPQSMEKAVIQELEKMVNQKIITKVEEPTDWVSNLLVVNRNGKLRLCLDPLRLNEAIKRPHYRIPNADELINKLPGTKLFTLFDAKKGFWHLQLDEESSKLTTFITPYGRYRYLRMPFGLNCAPEAFQMAMDRLFEKEPDINPYFDDILLGANSREQHCDQIRMLLSIARKSGLKLNRDKLQLGVETVDYLGHTLVEEGKKPSQDKLSAIAQFPEPKNKDDLRRFLGMATYLMQYVPRFSDHTLVLRSLLKKDTTFVWDANMTLAFQNLKELLTSAPVLHYFDPQLPIIVSADASSYGLGAVMLQKSHPVAYASAALNQTQQKYAQVEKELLAAVFGLERFHYYVYGRTSVVQTDHKPLLGLIKKPYHTASPRLQKLLMRWQRYQADLMYVPGKELTVADALSRAPIQQQTIQTGDEQQLQLCIVASISDPKMEKLRKCTMEDNDLQTVIQHVINGWPENKVKVQLAARPYWTHRTELHFVDGVLCRGQRLVIPKVMQRDILNRLHVGHRGVIACKNKARQAVFWPGLSQQVEDMVLSCEPCQQLQNHNQKEPLYGEEPISSQPWQKLGIDFFSCQQKNFLLVIDYFSKYPEVVPLKNMSAQPVISHLYDIYSRHGFPLQIVTDNGPPFNSKEFAKFNAEHDITHLTSSPLYARSNGQVERAVQTLKQGLKKVVTGTNTLATVLLDYRSTPAEDLPSPAEALMGRKLRTFYPIHPKALRPNYRYSYISKSLKERKYRQKKHGDLHSVPLRGLDNSEPVWYWTGKEWLAGVVLHKSRFPRSYIISDMRGRHFRRNRVHLRPRIVKAGPDEVEAKATEELRDKYPLRPITLCHASSSDGAVYQTEKNLDNQESGSKEPEQSIPVAGEQLNYHTKSGREVRKPARYCD